MIKIRILVLVLGLIPGVHSAFGQDRFEAPALTVGDQWTYQSKAGKFSMTVKGVTDEGFLIRGTRTTYIYDKSSFNVKFTAADDQKKKAEYELRNVFDFPLFVGKKWEDSMVFVGVRTGKKYNLSIEFKVEAQEEVQTPAGTYKALRIFTNVFIPEYRKNNYAWVRTWYSPEVKFWVKREYEKQAPGEEFWWFKVEDAVLANYKLKGK